MAFDNTQPTDTTKIRNLGVVIRPNWVAIEEAESTFRPYAINLQNRTPLPDDNDPATIADTSIIYCKDDAAANPEAFHKDGSGNIVQLTQAGKLGSSSTDLIGNTFTLGSTSIGLNNSIVAWGRFNYNAANPLATRVTFVNSSGLNTSITYTGVGQYTFTLSPALTNSNYLVFAQPRTGATAIGTQIQNISSSSFKVIFWKTSSTAVDTNGQIIVIGGA